MKIVYETPQQREAIKAQAVDDGKFIHCDCRHLLDIEIEPQKIITDEKTGEATVIPAVIEKRYQNFLIIEDEPYQEKPTLPAPHDRINMLELRVKALEDEKVNQR